MTLPMNPTGAGEQIPAPVLKLHNSVLHLASYRAKP